MTIDEVFSMAAKAGLLVRHILDYPEPYVHISGYGQSLERFAALVATAEREACVKVVEPSEEHRRDASWGFLGGTEGVEMLDGLVEAIRARGD